MTAEALCGFRDLKEGVWRNEGDRFEVTTERFRQLATSRYGTLVKEVRPRKSKRQSEE